jgi:hypothetical protein
MRPAIACATGFSGFGLVLAGLDPWEPPLPHVPPGDVLTLTMR